MASGWMGKTTSILTLVIAASLTTGCPVPLTSGYRDSSRENLDEGTRDRLQIGTSTREDTLLLLGEPDATGTGDAWLAYDSVYRRGGVVFLFCAYSSCVAPGSEKMQYRRLLVTFDETGRVKSADFVDEKCWEGVFLTDGPSAYADDLPPSCLPHYPSGSVEELADAELDVTRDLTWGAAGGGENTKYDAEPPLPNDLSVFASGNAELITPGWLAGLSAGADAAMNSQQAIELYHAGKWQALARRVLADNYGDDLRWYLLGRAAEGLGLCDAAEHYYSVSRERSQKFVTRCRGYGVGCAGIDVPFLLDERLLALQATRAAGRCATPAGTVP